MHFNFYAIYYKGYICLYFYNLSGELIMAQSSYCFVDKYLKLNLCSTMHELLPYNLIKGLGRAKYDNKYVTHTSKSG